MDGYNLTNASTDLEWNLVTVSYNSAAVLQKHWASFRPSPTVRWTVVDNNSSDDSVQIARSLGAHVIELTRNVGFGAANNIGARSVASQRVGFLNPDVELHDESLRMLSALLTSAPGIVVAPQLLDEDGTPQPSGRGLPSLLSKILNRLPSAGRRSYQILAAEGEQVLVSWVIGAAVLMNSATFEKILWDERFFIYYEDSDFGLRAWRAGHAVVVDGSVRWVHAWARETTGVNLKAWKRELPSMFKFYTRYPSLLLPSQLAARFYPEQRHFGKMLSSSGIVER
ncbi:glycosyltransferase [Curtobacterium aetherium]|uniref:glycosyltransferase n=1 Tax=Curtobacterium aetherium TaxID=2841594 RepID=UPI003B51E309